MWVGVMHSTARLQLDPLGKGSMWRMVIKLNSIFLYLNGSSHIGRGVKQAPNIELQNVKQFRPL